ncbi:unnamed protein product [Acanthosepion pharaonis]|uniref:Uncharacterized protein n=1 Tax=Acanthosepion pharaonis TaxID=158019 RepID=A0A812E918_ACAPH|nr:unnamed protein product [Sepia pharaonis]
MSAVLFFFIFLSVIRYTIYTENKTSLMWFVSFSFLSLSLYFSLYLSFSISISLPLSISLSLSLFFTNEDCEVLSVVIIAIRKITKSNAIQLPHQGSSGGNNAASTITLLSVSFYLIFTTLPVTLVFVINNNVPTGDVQLTDEQIRADPQWTSYFMFVTIRRLIEELCFSHYSCYFFVYCLTGPQFRKAFLALLPVKVCQALSHPNQGRYTIVTGNGRITNESCTTYV